MMTPERAAYVVAEALEEHSTNGLVLGEGERAVILAALKEGKLGLIGRDAALIEMLAKQVRQDTNKRHPVTNLWETWRAQAFDVQIHFEGMPTGHVARVTVELVRLEQ